MTVRTWKWVPMNAVLALHDEQVAEHGGIGGVRDAGLLESALARPQNLAAYGTPDEADLAASYAMGIARNHAFLDGNKRTAYVVAETFLLLNGLEMNVTDAEIVVTMLGVAEGSVAEAELAAWFRKWIQRLAD